MFYNFIYHLNGHPKFQITSEYRVPEVTGFTLCHTKEGNTTMDPFGLISLHTWGWFEPSSEHLKSNSKSPPSYSVSSDKLNVTDNFLIFPCEFGSLGLSYGLCHESQCQS